MRELILNSLAGAAALSIAACGSLQDDLEPTRVATSNVDVPGSICPDNLPDLVGILMNPVEPFYTTARSAGDLTHSTCTGNCVIDELSCAIPEKPADANVLFIRTIELDAGWTAGIGSCAVFDTLSRARPERGALCAISDGPQSQQVWITSEISWAKVQGDPCALHQGTSSSLTKYARVDGSHFGWKDDKLVTFFHNAGVPGMPPDWNLPSYDSHCTSGYFPSGGGFEIVFINESFP